jgi:glycosyltransferase involved in cell wall biosynthesis
MIVPTYNRAVPLADTLGDLIRQDYPASHLELIVVDNSSSDNTKEVVAGIAEAAAFPVAFYVKDNRGPSASRNYAIARSKGDILAFTDSDCRLSKDWVRTGVAHMTEGIGLVAGPVRPANNPDRIPGFFYHQIDHSREDAIFATANVFYRREAVELVGGFNEQYGTFPFGLPVGGEDTDLAWRVKRSGYASRFVPEAAVYHEATNLPLPAWLMEPIRFQIMAKLVHDFPELRKSLWARYFLSTERVAFYGLLTGMGATLATRRLRPLVLALPWFWVMRSMVTRDRAIKRWWRIPVKYGLTAIRHSVLTAALVYSSIRHRTPVF